MHSFITGRRDTDCLPAAVRSFGLTQRSFKRTCSGSSRLPVAAALRAVVWRRCDSFIHFGADYKYNGRRKVLRSGGMHGERAEREPVTGVCELSASVFQKQSPWSGSQGSFAYLKLKP